MAVLQNIRNKAGLLIGVIAVALLLFLVGDFLQNGSGGRVDRSIAEINGDDVDIEEYQNRINQLQEVYKTNTGQATLNQSTIAEIQDKSWESMVKDFVLEPEYEATGIAVHADEIFDLVQGENIHPMIRQLFANPQTGQVDKSQILNFLKSFDLDGGEERKQYWLFIEDELKRQRLNEKYVTLINKGVIVNSTEAAYMYEATKSNKSLDFFSVPYTSISDSTVSVSAAEVKAYYKENIENYSQTESRDIRYIAFPIEASTEDRQEVKKWSEEIATELAEVNDEKELVRYVKFNSDESWDQAYQTKKQIEKDLQEFAFNDEIGSIYGPYNTGDTYKIVKLADRAMRSDSVKASHILINNNSSDHAEELVDSLIEVLKADKSKMAELAEKFSLDQSSASEGGDLGWFKDGMMLKAFNDAAFDGNVGEVQKVESQYGTHILIVTEKSKPVEKALLATVSRKVEPSNTTYRNIYSTASKYRADGSTPEKLETIAQKSGKRIDSSNDLTRESKVVFGLAGSKEMVRWAFSAEMGDVSEVIEIDNMFIIEYLTKSNEKGYRPFEKVKNSIERELKKDKKGELIAEKINSSKESAKTITSLADKMGASIKTASDINFNSFSIPGAGIDPMLTGTIATAKLNEISDPILGSRGVYVIKVTNEDPNPSVISEEQTKIGLAQTLSYINSYKVYEALLELADVQDNRLLYY